MVAVPDAERVDIDHPRFPPPADLDDDGVAVAGDTEHDGIARQLGSHHRSNIGERIREGELELHEGTLYPLLYRLEEQGLVRTEWDTPERGTPRKYYRLTAPGRKRLEEMRLAWRRFSRRIDALLETAGAAEGEGESK